MRFCAPLLRSLCSGTTSPPFPDTAWLSTLKAAQLQRIAFLTGTSSSGTKPVLISRLSRVLQESGTGLESTTLSPKSRNSSPSSEQIMSILSIDMGIRNLAYAHLVVSSHQSSTTTSEKGEVKRDIRLNAWNRLAISSFPVKLEEESMWGAELAPCQGLELDKFNGGIATAATPAVKKSKRTSMEEEEEVPVVATRTEAGGVLEDTERKKESFAPHIYASHAYTLISSLISAYKPTHILIERQRFRSGGSSAVLEWTIRVGVFEGMLYAVLQTLKAESRRGRLYLSKEGDEVEQVKDLHVLGVEPQRVARYWAETVKGTELEVVETKRKGKGKGKERLSSKEGKKAKIDVIGSILSWQDGEVSSDSLAWEPPFRLCLDPDGQAREVADTFLEKWNRSNGRRKKTSRSPVLISDGKDRSSLSAPASAKKRRKKAIEEAKGDGQDASRESKVAEIGKLDDLADCLLQGLTWIAWQDMRERIVQRGINAVPFE
ncbi:hypothetical protein VTO42DRAFT_8756 [Malbranchea cinnamomea]